jgi:AraC family transcriptional regulator of adaptative response/methylated-DNA-[protein]-cysteine methyltransferase
MEKHALHWLQSDTIFGSMLMVVSAAGLTRLTFGEDVADLARFYPATELEQGGAMAVEIAPIVEAIVAGYLRPKASEALPIALDMRGTDFQRAVWQLLLKIPEGQTRSYADLARSLGVVGGDRAVGGANGANPVAIIVPCHRVIRSDGGLGGYAYGVPMKEALLRREGALQPDLFA